MIARQTYKDHPLDFDGLLENSPARVHLVVVGTCELSFALAVKALQLCQFANRSRLLLTVAEKGAQNALDRLRRHHPHAEPWYDATAIECDPADGSLPGNVARLPCQGQFLTVAICAGISCNTDGQAESANILLAMTITEALKTPGPAGGPSPRARYLRATICIPAGWMRWWRLFLQDHGPKRTHGGARVRLEASGL